MSSPASRHYVYCVCASEANYYAEMAMVSAWLLRRVDAAARITIHVDEVTDDKPPAVLKDLRRFVDGYRVVRTGQARALPRSRILKVTTRGQTEGEFVSLDTDTLPLREPTGLWQAEGDVAGVPDPEAYDHDPAAHLEDFRALGWGEALPKVYLNSGVLRWRDTEAAWEAGRLWERLYRQYMAYGKQRDQPPLARAIEQSGARVCELPRRYNAMVLADGQEMSVRHAAIVHTWTGDNVSDFGLADRSVLHVAAKGLKARGELDTELLERYLAEGDPWGGHKSVRRLWALGRYGRAIRRALGQAPRKLLERAGVGDAGLKIMGAAWWWLELGCEASLILCLSS